MYTYRGCKRGVLHIKAVAPAHMHITLLITLLFYSLPRVSFRDLFSVLSLEVVHFPETPTNSFWAPKKLERVGVRSITRRFVFWPLCAI
jgi:hypothetical protein